MILPEKALQMTSQVLEHLEKDTILQDSLVYMAGSIFEGFGNEYSDIDVYVICKGLPQDVRSANGDFIIVGTHSLVRNIICGGIRYDYEYWKWDDVFSVINRLNEINLQTTDHIKQLPHAELDFLHRLKYAKAIYNSEKLDEICSLINFDKLDCYFATIMSEKYAGLLEDTQGSLLSSDYGTAFFLGRQFLDCMTTAFLATFGETNPNIKWLYRKLQRYQEKTGDNELLFKYLSLQSRPTDFSQTTTYIKDVLKYCQDLNVRIQQFLQEKQLKAI